MGRVPLLLLAVVCLACDASAQIPDTAFLEQLTWDEVRDLIADATGQAPEALVPV